MIFFRHLLVFLGAGLLSALFAQVDMPPVERVSVRVLAMEGFVTDLAVRSPQGRSRVVARASAFGKGIDALVTDGKVAFFRHGATPAGASPVLAEEAPVADFAIQPGIDRYLVIVAASGTGERRRFQVYAVADSETAFSTRQARVINFSGRPLAVRLGDESLVIGESRSSVMACVPGTDGHVALQLAIPMAGEQWHLVASTRVSVAPGRRMLMLVTPSRSQVSVGADFVDAEGGILDLKFIYDGAVVADAAPNPASSSR